MGAPFVPGMNLEDAHRAAHQSPGVSMVPTSRRALVADDADLTCWALEKVLAAEGFDVERANTREEFIGRLMGGGYDLLVVSCRLGHQGVCDLVKQVRQRRPATHVIALVEPEDEADQQSSDDCADVLRIEKPFCVNALVAAVRGLTQTTAPVSAGPTAEAAGDA